MERIVVIGGGIAGASAAYELSAHRDVVLVEREAFCGYHTTGRSAALFTEAWETGIPGLLTTASRSFHESPPEGFTETPILSPLAAMIVGEESQRASVDSVAAGAWGRVALRRFEGEEIVEACPVLDPGVIVTGVLEDSSREIDVAALHQGFLRGIRGRGGRVLTGAGVSGLMRDGGGWLVRTAAGDLRAEVVVNAAGAWADHVARLAGIGPIGLQPMRRTAFTFDAPGDVSSWPMVVDADERFYFKPERTQVMASLAEETPMEPHDVRPEEIDVALAIERIEHATTLEIRHVKRTWAGLRTFAPDRGPVNGFDPDAEGFFWLAGQGGFGIMTAPAMARAAAGLIVDGALPADLVAHGLAAEALSPARLR